MLVDAVRSIDPGIHVPIFVMAEEHEACKGNGHSRLETPDVQPHSTQELIRGSDLGIAGVPHPVGNGELREEGIDRADALGGDAGCPGIYRTVVHVEHGTTR